MDSRTVQMYPWDLRNPSNWGGRGRDSTGALGSLDATADRQECRPSRSKDGQKVLGRGDGVAWICRG